MWSFPRRDILVSSVSRELVYAIIVLISIPGVELEHGIEVHSIRPDMIPLI
jgi:hypothetical protein